MALESGQTLLDYADYLLLPDEPRGEVFDGVFIVTPSPLTRHQILAGALYRQLANWLDEHPEVGNAYIAPLDVVLRVTRPAVIVQPDVFFVSAARAAIVETRNVQGAPDLVVEVVSPTSGGRDAVSKHAFYARYGVREYWLVWPEESRIDVFAAASGGSFAPVRTLAPGDDLATDLLPGFALDVARLFASR